MVEVGEALAGLVLQVAAGEVPEAMHHREAAAGSWHAGHRSVTCWDDLDIELRPVVLTKYQAVLLEDGAALELLDDSRWGHQVDGRLRLVDGPALQVQPAVSLQRVHLVRSGHQAQS